MRELLSSCLIGTLIVAVAACHNDNPPDDHETTPPVTTLSHVQQIPPPPDLKEPPAGAVRTATGIAYKKLVSNDAAAQPHAEDTALIHYTAWRRTGETFFTTKARSQPIAVRLSHSTSAFSEVLPLLRKGERVRVWAPPSRTLPDGVVYEIELEDIVSAAALAKASAPDRNGERNKSAVPNSSAVPNGTASQNSSAGAGAPARGTQP